MSNIIEIIETRLKKIEENIKLIRKDLNTVFTEGYSIGYLQQKYKK